MAGIVEGASADGSSVLNHFARSIDNRLIDFGRRKYLRRELHVGPFAEGIGLSLVCKQVIKAPELRARLCDQHVEPILSDSLYDLRLGFA